MAGRKKQPQSSDMTTGPRQHIGITWHVLQYTTVIRRYRLSIHEITFVIASSDKSRMYCDTQQLRVKFQNSKKEKKPTVLLVTRPSGIHMIRECVSKANLEEVRRGPGRFLVCKNELQLENEGRTTLT